MVDKMSTWIKMSTNMSQENSRHSNYNERNKTKLYQNKDDNIVCLYVGYTIDKSTQWVYMIHDKLQKTKFLHGK